MGKVRRFNSAKHEKFFNRLREEALKEGYTEEELDNISLSYLYKKTKSSRILRYITLAYILGRMSGVASCDELFHGVISLQPLTTREKVRHTRFVDSAIYTKLENSKINYILVPSYNIFSIRDTIVIKKDKSDDSLVMQITNIDNRLENQLILTLSFL